MLSVGYMHSFKYLGVYLRNKLDWTVTRDLSLHLSRSNGFSRVSARMLTKLKSIEDNISQPLQHSVETLSSSGTDQCTLSARRYTTAGLFCQQTSGYTSALITVQYLLVQLSTFYFFIAKIILHVDRKAAFFMPDIFCIIDVLFFSLLHFKCCNWENFPSVGLIKYSYS